MEADDIGFGVERIPYTPEEVSTIKALMDLTGGSMYDALKSYSNGNNLDANEMLRLVYIAENRGRLTK